MWSPKRRPPDGGVQGREGGRQPEEAGQDRGGAEEGRDGGGAQVRDGDQQGPGQVPGGTCAEGHPAGGECDQLERGKGERASAFIKFLKSQNHQTFLYIMVHLLFIHDILDEVMLDGKSIVSV